MIIYEHLKYTKQGESFIPKFFRYIDLISYISFMCMRLIFDILMLLNYTQVKNVTNKSYPPYIKILRNFLTSKVIVFKFLEIKPARVVHILVHCFLILMQNMKAYKGLKPQNGKRPFFLKLPRCGQEMKPYNFYHFAQFSYCIYSDKRPEDTAVQEF